MNIGSKLLAAGLLVGGVCALPVGAKSEPNGVSVSQTALFGGFDGKWCKIAPSVASDGGNLALMSYSMLNVAGSDVFSGQYVSKSTDGGRTWSKPEKVPASADVYERGLRVARYVSVYYSAVNRKWYAMGSATMYENDKGPFQRYVDGKPYCYPVQADVDIDAGTITNYRPLPFPLKYELAMRYGQVVECENGEVLMPFYFRPIGAGKRSQSIVVRYRLGKDGWEVVRAGRPFAVPSLVRGVGEPSLVRFRGKYYLTLRSDEYGMFAESDDGLNFSDPVKWAWEDGKPIGNANTQQHWVPVGDRLYLAYTRVTPTNGHVFRNRAPIFIAEFDAAKRCLRRETEVAVVPERGARLGNFTVAPGHGQETWLVTAEWMQPKGCEKYGSDNSLWLVKVQEEPKLHPIFRDGMVFAAGKPMRIYGSGRGPVKVTFRGKTYAAEDAADGWRVTLPPAAPAGAETLTVDLGGRRTVLKDVRLGEVFLAAGQSNWRVTFAESTTDRTGWTDEPRLRCFTAPSVEELPFSPEDGWVPFTAKKAPEWSALITLFGRERLAAGAAAFGAVGCYQGASVIESWLPEEVAKRPGFALPKEKLHIDHFMKEYSRWNSPGTLYNEVFRQIGPFAFSGVVWYQGESNTGPGEAAAYPKWLGELVKTWRRDLEDPELKFMIVQIADLNWRNDADWHALQAAQVEAADALQDVVAVRSSDVCESANVHPREKSGLARRLSRTWDAIQTRGNLDISYDVANPGGLKSFTIARRTMNRDFTVCGVRYRFPGEIDWTHNPTYNNYCEWPWQFARHYFLPELAEYYRVTEDPAAFACFTNLVGGFIDRAPPPPEGTSPYATKSWRTLDAGLRASMWMASWPAFAKAPGMTDAFRRKFVRSLKDHIVRLRPCRTYNNWRVMELGGLVEIALNFPELDPDGAILRGAEDEYRNILATQLHPDGFSFELSPGYHGILPKVFSALAERYRKAGRTPPEDLEKGLELAYELYPRIVRPDRCTPDVNDSGSGSIVSAMETAARLFPNRADFRWFATEGREGRAPEYLSYAFPNAGAVVFRDGWTTNAVWGYVDMGPFGYAHQHEDKLNFLLFAYGKEILTEGGIYDYDTSEMRKYVLSTRGHNTVRIDGHDQFAGKTEGHWRYMTKDASGKPIVDRAVLAAKADLKFTTTSARDFAEATFAHGYNAGGQRDDSVTHTRTVEFVKDEGAPYFRVTDTLKARDEREHSYEQLWHLETCELRLGEKSFVADFGDGVTLEATFASANGRLVDLKGQKTPEYQGWLPIRPCGDHEHRPIHTPTLRGTFRGSVKIVVEFRPRASDGN